VNDQSKALDYIKTKGWNYRENDGQIVVEVCPMCHKENFHFYVARGGTKDGLWDCKVCGESGNLRRLMEESGDRVAGVQSFKDMSQNQQREAEALPDVARCHEALLNDADALSYLEDVRGYSIDVIRRQKLGLATRRFKELGEVPVIVMPYIVGENIVYAKYRTIPPAEKKFDSPRGHQAPLYNEQVIKHGLQELVFVEGEGDALAMMSAGIDYVVGIPGANLQKAAWITKLDKAEVGQVYLLYDRDPVGQKAAYEMALRIGINRVKNIVLPEFEYADPKTGDKRPGKDINEWFQSGHSPEDFEDLKKNAEFFNVAGVTSLDDALQQIVDEIDQKDGKLMAEFRTPWPSLTKHLGGADRGDLVMVIATEKVGKTTFALNWLDDQVAQGQSALMYCLEMPPHRMARKWVSLVTETDDSPTQSDDEAILRGKAMKQAINDARILARERVADILFGYTKEADLDLVFETIRQTVRRYGVRIVCFDNLQLLADLTLKNPSFRTTHLSQISKRFKLLAVELGILLILIIQPNRVRDGQIVDANNADGSSQLQKDCDSMIAIHRNLKANISASDFAQMGGFIDEEQAMEPQALVKVSRSRYAPGGSTTLWFEGGISKFREFEEHQRRTAEAQAQLMAPTNGVIPTEQLMAGV
jgi:replicative DNA helicase/5S rRNA maturation endonuclease (ribonuclease M5)